MPKPTDFNKGMFNFDTTNYFNNYLVTSISPMSYTGTFPSPFTSPGNAIIILSMYNMEYNGNDTY